MNFFKKYATMIGLLGILSLVFSVALLFFIARGEAKSELETLVLTPNVVDLSTLPGPRGNISERSKLEIETLLAQTPSVIGAWVTSSENTGPDNLIHYWGRNPDTEKVMGELYNVIQTGTASNTTERQIIQIESMLRQSEEIKKGLIKCENIQVIGNTDIQGICYSSIPPFSTEVNIVIVVFVSVPNATDFVTLRRTLLRLQLDIFNRDYRARETWEST